MIHYHILLAHWISHRYTSLSIFLWSTTLSYLPTDYPYGKLLSSSGPLDISRVHYYLLLAQCISLLYTALSYWPTGYLYGTLLCSTSPLNISMVHYYLLLDISKVHYPLLLAQWISLWYTTLSHWPTDYPYGTLLASTDSLYISLVHYPLLLAHWLSL